MTQHQLRTPSEPVRPAFARRLPHEASERRRGLEHGQTAERHLLARPAAPLVVRDHALALGAVRRRFTLLCAAASSLLPSPRPPASFCASLRRLRPKLLVEDASWGGFAVTPSRPRAPAERLQVAAAGDCANVEERSQ